MIAIRRDEDLDNIHSVYVDQWDWEKIITKEERNMDTLDFHSTCYLQRPPQDRKIHGCTVRLHRRNPSERDLHLSPLRNWLTCIRICTPKEREYKIVKEKGAVFLMQVGKTLTNGERHDGRAPDYDDWELNGDILVYYPVLDIALELSSMGIRVDEDALDSQLTERRLR